MPKMPRLLNRWISRWVYLLILARDSCRPGKSFPRWAAVCFVGIDLAARPTPPPPPPSQSLTLAPFVLPTITSRLLFDAKMFTPSSSSLCVCPCLQAWAGLWRGNSCWMVDWCWRRRLGDSKNRAGQGSSSVLWCKYEQELKNTMLYTKVASNYLQVPEGNPMRGWVVLRAEHWSSCTTPTRRGCVSQEYRGAILRLRANSWQFWLS